MVTEVESGEAGLVALYGGSRRIAEFRFKRPGTPHNPFIYHPEDVDDYINGDVDFDQRETIIDLLRNESPIKLFVWHDDTPNRVISTVRLNTASSELEPVGEGEG